MRNELKENNFANWEKVNYLLWKEVLLISVGDSLLTTFCSGMWKTYLWVELEDFYESGVSSIVI